VRLLFVCVVDYVLSA